MNEEEQFWLSLKSAAVIAVAAAALEHGFDKGFTYSLILKSFLAVVAGLIIVSVVRRLIEWRTSRLSAETGFQWFLRLTLPVAAVAMVLGGGWICAKYIFSDETESSKVAAWPGQAPLPAQGGGQSQAASRPSARLTVSERTVPAVGAASRSAGVVREKVEGEPEKKRQRERNRRRNELPPTFEASKATLLTAFPVLTDNDYPAAAMQAREQGQVLIGFEISPSGVVSSCWVIQSSGSPTLDETSCRLWTTRARYKPARGSNGRAIWDTQTQRIRWQFP